MTRIKWFLALIIGVHSALLFALESEHILWDKAPIHLSLALNSERIVQFPNPISVIENEMGDNLSVLKVNNTLYLKAKTEFHDQRLLIQLMPQGEVIILSLSADKKIKPKKSVDIVLQNNEVPEEKNESSKNNLDLNIVTLTRFAIQSLYAPDRLRIIPDSVSRIPMQTKRHINLFFGAKLESHPLISWHGGDFYITAVELKNLLNHKIIIDPRHIVGHWQTATLYPKNTLAPRGKEDTTTVFLVSDRPFNEAISANREFVR